MDDGRRAHGERTRTALLDATAALIGEEGWGRVSVRAVADRAGVRSGVVHYHFDSAEALRREAATRALRAAVLAMEDVMIADPTAAIRALADDVARPGFTVEPAYLVATETYLAAVREPEVAAIVREIVRALRAALQHGLTAAGRDPDDARTSAAAVAAMIEGLVLHRSLDAEFPVRAVAERLVAMVEADR